MFDESHDYLCFQHSTAIIFFYCTFLFVYNNHLFAHNYMVSNIPIKYKLFAHCYIISSVPVKLLGTLVECLNSQPQDGEKERNIYEKENQGKQREKVKEKGYKEETDGKV